MLGQSCSPCPPNSAVSAPLQSQAVPDMAAISLTPGRAAPPSNSRHRLGPQRSAAEPMQAPGWAALIPKDAPFPRMTVPAAWVPAASSVPALTGAPRPWPMGSHCHPVGPHGSLLRASLVKPAPTPETAGAARKSSWQVQPSGRHSAYDTAGTCREHREAKQNALDVPVEGLAPPRPNRGH